MIRNLRIKHECNKSKNSRIGSPGRFRVTLEDPSGAWGFTESYELVAGNKYRFEFGIIENLLKPDTFEDWLEKAKELISYPDRDWEILWKLDGKEPVYVETWTESQEEGPATTPGNTELLLETTAIGELDEDGNDGPNVPWVQPIDLRAGEWIGDSESPWAMREGRICPNSWATHYGREIYWIKDNKAQKMTCRELADYIEEHRKDPGAQGFLKEVGGFDEESAKKRPTLSPAYKGGEYWMDSFIKNGISDTPAYHRGYRILAPEPDRNIQLSNRGLVQYLMGNKDDIRTRELLDFGQGDNWRIETAWRKHQEEKKAYDQWTKEEAHPFLNPGMMDMFL